MAAVPTRNQDGFYYFSKEGDPRLFFCSHTNFPGIDYNFVHQLDRLRQTAGIPFYITSGYRSASHPAEVKKTTPGTHNQGIAADIAVGNGQDRRTIVAAAIKLGFKGIGVAEDFVHVDMRAGPAVLWTYD